MKRASVFVCLSLAFACQPAKNAAPRATEPPTPQPWQRAAPNDAPARAETRRDFQFAIVSDRTGGHRDHVFETALRKANLLKPDFVMSVGDLIEGYSTDVAEIGAEWDEFRGFVGELEMPFYFVPGNHDLSNPVMAAVWKQRLGPSYYHFVYGDVLFLCLNTEDGAPSRISDEQIEYARRALAENSKVRWTLLFMHKPLWNPTEDPQGRAAFERLEALLGERPYTVFAGHHHTYKKTLRNDRRYIVLATTGGGSELRGPVYGQFDELAWVSMTDTGPRLANVLVDGILEEDVRTDASAARVDALSAALGVSVENFYVKGARFSGGTTHIRVENRSDNDVQFSAALGATAPITPAPHRFEPVLVKRGESLSLPIQLKLEQLTPLTLLKALPISWNAKVLDAAQPLLLSDGLALGVSELHTLQKRTKPVVVDGRLDEWGKLSFAADGRYHRDSSDYPRARPTAEDLSLAFDLGYDDDNLYVAVRVRDNAVIADKARLPWEQDGIELSIDVRDDPLRGANRRVYSDAWRNYAYVALGAPDAQGEVSLFDPGKIPKSVRVVCARTADGYAAEFAFPHAALDATRAAGSWRGLRINVGVNERDERNGPKTMIWWQPDWHWDDNVPGSGTFESARKPFESTRKN